jgi:catechol 2,3-dioxygenase-like lactoylglutathione lyase family enzyme
MSRHAFAFVALSSIALGCGADAPTSLADTELHIAHDAELSHAIPIFNVGDLRESQRYYRDVLGFSVDWEDGDPPEFGAVSRGDAIIFMCQGCQGHPGGWIMVFSRDVDALHQEFVRRGAIVKRPPTDMPWRLREMIVEDPDGNTIRFATHRPH